ncbi:MAG: hypothetical protein JJ971_13950 [Balneolaceae bacterium]|nr:hypothetical protein [Balneolaceae bacterium]MBO6547039.1 hypothetical protein [Balneolaceae bacterium]MBO6648014.1 hypothetical protein [Balneolaceae bacterium]
MNWIELNSHAYVPYSTLPRACIIKGSEGGFYAGVRIENISFPLTISAIQAACCICLSEGENPEVLYIQDEEFVQLAYWQAEFSLTIEIISDISDIEVSTLLIESKPDEKKVLKKLLDKATTIHSNFPVSCLLYCESAYFEGVNVEVSDWSFGLCAERVALAKAIASGVSTFTELAVHTKYGDVSSPCGACRQVIFEHLPFNKIRLYHADDTFSEHNSVDLLPLSFTSKALKK